MVETITHVVKGFLFYEKTGGHTGPNGRKETFSHDRKDRLQSKFGSRMKTCFKILVFSILSFVIIGQIGLSIYVCKNVSATQAHFEGIAKTMKHGRSYGTKVKMNVEDTLPSYLDDPRIVCAENRGTFKWQFRRCFFLLKHDDPGLNFTGQVDACERRKATLSYPRSETEVSVLWDFFEESMGYPSLAFYRNITLSIGLKMTKYSKFFGAWFGSVDGKMNDVSTATHPDWFKTNSVGMSLDRMGPGFRGPGVCVTKAKIVSRCMPRTLKKYSICSSDLE